MNTNEFGFSDLKELERVEEEEYEQWKWEQEAEKELIDKESDSGQSSKGNEQEAEKELIDMCETMIRWLDKASKWIERRKKWYEQLIRKVKNGKEIRNDAVENLRSIIDRDTEKKLFDMF